MPFDLSPDRLRDIRDWLDDHGPAAISAASFVGGPRAGAAILGLCDEIARAEGLNRRHLVGLQQLWRLLTGQDADDLFVDPADPRIIDVCRLADSLQDLLERTGLLDP